MLWVVFGTHITVYTLINSYLNQKLLVSEREANSKFDKASTARLEIQALLVERENLIANLLKTNKTAVTGALAASLAHELSQPLGSSLLNAQHLLSMMRIDDSNPGMNTKIVESIEADTKRAGQIIHSLRSLFSGDEISFELVDVTKLVHSLVQLVEPECKASKITLSVNLPENCLVEVNYIELYQVILNLINNAIQSLNRSERTIAKQIQILINHEDSKVLLSVIDNGDGIPDEHQNSLFDLLDPNKSSGLGIGLWLCRHIMTKHHAEISFDHPAEGFGAIFTLKIPLKQPTQ
jgi:signal transduction histidine kinase